MMIAPPSRYPDLFAVLNVLISTPVFVLTWLWSIKCGVEVRWALSGLGPSKASKDVDASRDGGMLDGIHRTGARSVSTGNSQSKR